MIFEQFLKDTRKSLGISQGTLAERAGTTFQNISRLENRTNSSCTFDNGMNLLNALGVSVIIENNQIILKGEYDNMSSEMKDRVYKKEDLDFVNFNVNDIYELQKSKIVENEELSAKMNQEAFDMLSKNGYEVYCSRFFMDRLWDADHYPVGESLVTISKGDRRIDLVVSGGVHIEYFLFEDFISDIKTNYPQEGAFIEKVLMFECMNNDRGSYIFDAFSKRKDISNISPLLNGYEDIINDTLNNDNYIYTLYEEYDPRELTISDMLGIYDCYSSNYPYYAFTMPDEERILPFDSFEGHDIWDALNYAMAYFEHQYDRMIKEYEESPDEFVTL